MEKLHALFAPHEVDAPQDARPQAAAQFEAEKVTCAIKSDFTLSAESMTFALVLLSDRRGLLAGAAVLALLNGVWVRPLALSLAGCCAVTIMFHLLPDDPWQMMFLV